MDKPYFVMLTCQNGGITPMMWSENHELATFKTESDAIEGARNTLFGRAFGFEVFEVGTGTSR